jgi:hypothetical protein
MSSDSDEFFTSLLAKVDGLQHKLSEKEAECESLATKNRMVESRLVEKTDEAKSAREELEQEATKSNLLSQQLAQVTQARDQAIQSKSRAEADKAAMDSTLSLLHRQLLEVKANLTDLQRDKEESTAYYESMLMAKETSISSLQQLMENHQRSHVAAVELYEEQLSSLRAAQGGEVNIAIPQPKRGGFSEERAHNASSSSSAVLRGRITEMESLLLASSSKLELMSRGMKEREKLLARAERKIHELSSDLAKAQNPPPREGGHTSHTFEAREKPLSSLSDHRPSYDQSQGSGGGGEDHLSPSRPLKDALRLLKHASLDKRDLQSHLELVQASFAEERRRREVASSQLLFKTEEIRHLSKKLEEEQELSLGLRAEVTSLKERLILDASLAKESLQMARKESDVLHSIKIETLSMEIDRMRVKHEEGLRAAEALHRQRFVAEQETLRAKIRVRQND